MCVCVCVGTHILLPDLFVQFFPFLTVPYLLCTLLSIVRTVSLITCYFVSENCRRLSRDLLKLFEFLSYFPLFFNYLINKEDAVHM